MQHHGPWCGLAFGALAFLGVCEAVMTIAHHYGSGIIGRFQYAGAGHDFTTATVGNPISVPNETVGRLVTDAMQENYSGAVTRFTGLPPLSCSTVNMSKTEDQRWEQAA